MPVLEEIAKFDTWQPGQNAKPSSSAPRQGKSAIWNPQNRRYSREWAMQMLFLMDTNPPPEGPDKAIEEFWKMQALEDTPPERKNLRDFAEALFRGAWTNRDAIDRKLASYLENWSLERIGSVERAVLRLAAFELFHCDDTPPVVILNEAIDITRFFSTTDSASFVNGVLDRAIKDAGRDPRKGRKPAWLRRREERKDRRQGK